MPKFKVRVGLSGGFGGCENNEWEEIEANDYGEAEMIAWQMACEEYESYVGLHGLRDIDEIMEQEDVDEIEAEDIFQEEREDWLDYEVEEIK